MGTRRIVTEEDVGKDEVTKEELAPDEVTGSEAYLDEASGQVVIPVGGGTASITFTMSGLEKVSQLISIETLDLDPSIVDYYRERGLSITGNQVGCTVAAGTGTTASLRATCLGTTA